MNDYYSFNNGYVVLFAFVWEQNLSCLPFHGTVPNFCKIVNVHDFTPATGITVSGVAYALKVL